jgi:membrane-bound lytic murein transglycosylase D
MLSFAILVTVGFMSPAQAAPADSLPFPPELAPAVSFWKQVFGELDDDQVVFFDARHLDKVYEIHRLPPQDGSRATERKREKLRETWKEGLAQDLEALSADGVDYDRLQGRRERLFRLWDESRDPTVYRAAAEDLRTQRGAKAKFRVGVARSARYVESFRAIFREEGVPEDIVFLPHVESSYRWDAKSKVGALGMWQFMAGTARRYMVVDQAVDERLDPHTAARSAARFLKDCHDELGAWPLAVTSYNHGVDGMKNAVRETGTTDIVEIIENYRGPLFGFAGRNFYPELLAATAVAESLLADPGDLPLESPEDFAIFELPAYAKLTTVAEAFDLKPRELLELNPAIRGPAKTGDLHLTRGFQLKIPFREGLDPQAAFASIPAKDRPLERPMLTYRVRPGDSLSAIASRHKTTVRALQRLNDITNPHQVRAGMVLRLPH